MATTAESIRDAVAWIGRFAQMAARRALILAVLIALFVAAVLWSTREEVSDCADVTAAQRGRLESLRDHASPDGFGPTTSGECVAGEFIAPIDGVAGDIEVVTADLEERGFIRVAEFVPLFADAWWRCFRHDGQDWRELDVRVRADRQGVVSNVEVFAPENDQSCKDFPGVGEL